MVEDMDRLLQLLAEAPLPSALAGIEAGVFERIARKKAQDFARRALATTAGVALVVGMIGGLWPVTTPTVETLTPFAGGTALAPSKPGPAPAPPQTVS